MPVARWLTSRTRWLSEREKSLAGERLARDAGSADGETLSFVDSIKLAARDYKLWLMGLIYATMTTAGGYTAFIPTVVNTFGMTRVKT